MNKSPARIRTLEVQPGRRILVVSDIHGNLAYFKGLLAKAGFCDNDVLIIAGDTVDKGPENLATLRYVMELCKGGNVVPLCGNCDDWLHIFRPGEDGREWVLRYVRRKRCGFLWEMLWALGIDPDTVEHLEEVKAPLAENFAEEWAFLGALPHAVECGDFIFAHAAVDPDKPLREHLVEDLERCDRFLSLGRHFDKWVVVGHYPVVLYGENTVCAAPVVDREHHVISIDGGCVLKDDGQLNALVIPDIRSTEFDYIAYDPFPTARVLSDQSAGERSYYIRWGDNQVEVLERGGEFSRVRHVRTGYEMDILTKYLFTDETVTQCNDCTDYVLPLRAGDEVSVVETTGRGYFVKHKSVSGWYRGELRFTD